MTFNLVDREWIHVVTLSGDTSAVGLRDLFHRAHELERIQFSTAIETGAVSRLLEAITYRVTGLDANITHPVWQTRRNELFADQGFDSEPVDAYFDTWAHRFDLFDASRPFAQDPRLPGDGVSRKTLGKVVYDIPAGANVAWFGPYPPGQLPAAEATPWLLGSLCSGSGGRTGSRKGKADSKQPPARGALSVHLAGVDLRQTLLANLGPPTGNPEGFPWESDLPETEPGSTLTGLIDTPNRALGRWVNAFLLDHDGQSATGVWNSWAFSNRTEVDDPHLAYFDYAKSKTKIVRRVKQADPSRALWRDLTALVQDPAASSLTGRPSGVEIVRAASGITDTVADTLGVTAYSNKTNKSKELGAWEATAPGIGRWLLDNPDQYFHALAVLGLIENQGQALTRALREVAKDVGIASDTLVTDARAGYFARAASTFGAETRSDTHGRDENLLVNELRRSALSEFDRLTSQTLVTPRHCEAVGKARLTVTTVNRTRKAER